MNFQNLQNIDSYDFYLDVAFSRAKKKIDQLKGTKKRWRSETDKAKTFERTRIESARDNLSFLLRDILESFPSFDSLSDFYKELIELYYPLKDLKKALASIDWAVTRNRLLAKDALSKLRTANSKDLAEELRRSYYGRLSSVMKQIQPYLEILENARKDLKKLPAVKDSLFTVAIVGFPNVGKSTLLSKLTFSMPEAKSYPFTTKGINLGYARIKHEKIQFIDTPGSLNRKDKMNYIEKQADLAMKYLADVLLYVFDLTEEYPLETQVKLYEKVKKEARKPLLVYLSKTDIIDENKIMKFREEYRESLTSPEEVMETLVPIFNQKS